MTQGARPRMDCTELVRPIYLCTFAMHILNALHGSLALVVQQSKKSQRIDGAGGTGTGPAAPIRVATPLQCTTKEMTCR